METKRHARTDAAEILSREGFQSEQDTTERLSRLWTAMDS